MCKSRGNGCVCGMGYNPEKPSENEKVGRCHNCGGYFQMSESPDGGTTCSAICSQQYATYLSSKEVKK